MSGIAGVAGGVTGAGLSVGGPQQPEPASPFSGMLKSMVAETNDLSQKANAAVTGLLSGSGVDVHEAMIATQKADVAFELALQVRNKAVAAYQQMLSMQF
jgi:flagellar hook-basal body complex protein FliE